MSNLKKCYIIIIVWLKITLSVGVMLQPSAHHEYWDLELTLDLQAQTWRLTPASLWCRPASRQTHRRLALTTTALQVSTKDGFNYGTGSHNTGSKKVGSNDALFDVSPALRLHWTTAPWELCHVASHASWPQVPQTPFWLKFYVFVVTRSE